MLRPKTAIRFLVVIMFLAFSSLLICFSVYTAGDWSGLGAIISLGTLTIIVIVWAIVIRRSLDISQGSIMLDSRGKIVKLFLQNTEEWRKACAGFFIEPFSQTGYEIEMEVAPITANPKVRKIRYNLEFEIPTFQVEVLDRLRSWVREKFSIQLFPSTQEIENRVKYELHEFNDKHSSELAAFYNPLDQSQQTAFAKLLQDFLKTRMPDAILITKAKFALV